MNAEVFVHAVASAAPGIRIGQRALFVSPSMSLVEKPSSYLAHLARVSPSNATSRNNAYALSYWFNFCIEADIEWDLAGVDDIYDYKDVLGTTISPATGRYRSDGTLAQYLGAVVEYYAYAYAKGWYAGDIRKGKGTRRYRRTDSDALAHIRTGPAATRKVSPVKVKAVKSPTMIKPLSIASLRRLLAVLGHDAGEAQEGESIRNRLIGDWGWAVGLRVSEMLSLDVNQFATINVSDDSPWIHYPIVVLGKGNKYRQVSVPGWLIAHTKKYIEGERAFCMGLRKDGATESSLFVSRADSSFPGVAIGARRVEAIFERAYIEANLCRYVDRIDPDSGARTRSLAAAHCVHDLRHTYAVLTYHAEVAQGNSEPWKKIQAQLGHSSMTTTIDIYLEYVNAHNDFRHASLRDLIGLPRV